MTQRGEFDPEVLARTRALDALKLKADAPPPPDRPGSAPNDAVAAVFDDAARNTRARTAEPRKRETQP